MRKWIIIIIILLLASSAVAFAQKPAVSMLDLSAVEDATGSKSLAATDSLATLLDRAGAFDMILPEHRDRILSQKGFWIEGFTSLPEKLVCAGRHLNVNMMAGGDLGKKGSLYSLNLQLADVTNAQVIARYRAEKLAGIPEVSNSLTEAVRQFSAAVVAAGADTLKTSPGRGSCKISSTPSGAKLYIDGLSKGSTPLRVDSLLAGPHQAFLDLAGYRRAYQVAHIKNGRLDSITIGLEHRKADEPIPHTPGNPVANQPDTSTRPKSPAAEEIPDKNAYVAVDKNPEPVKMPQPVYPEIAKKVGISGKVYVQMLIDADGRVIRADVAKSSGNVTLDEAAVEAALQWVFSPAIDKNGKPVRVWVMHPFTFKLD
ncbi:MAG: TonB family protein [Candidatus Edwardsbacteria bacterium]|nr:TonB family protein [Candidatus Edwardsbacteria bacterium]